MFGLVFGAVRVQSKQARVWLGSCAKRISKVRMQRFGALCGCCAGAKQTSKG